MCRDRSQPNDPNRNPLPIDNKQQRHAYDTDRRKCGWKEKRIHLSKLGKWRGSHNADVKMRLRIRTSGIVTKQVVYVVEGEWRVSQLKQELQKGLELGLVDISCDLDGFQLLDSHIVKECLRDDEVLKYAHILI